MAQQFFYYPPPQPVQPVPHVPIPNQGQQPRPSDPMPFAEWNMRIIGLWQPPPPMPTQKAVTPAPLALTYGQQPPHKGPMPHEKWQMRIVSAWQPPPPMPWQLPVIPAPLTLRYGSQPPAGPTQYDICEKIIRQSWEPPPSTFTVPWQEYPVVTPSGTFFPIAFRDKSSDDIAAPGATIDVVLPAATQYDDILILVICGNKATGAPCGTWTAPAGWTRIGLNDLDNNGTNAIAHQVFWASGSVANLTFTKSGTVDNVGWVIAAFKAISKVEIVDVIGSSQNSLGTNNLTVPSIIITTDNSWWIITATDYNTGSFSSAGFSVAQNAHVDASAAILYNTTPQPRGDTGTQVITSSAPTGSQVIGGRAFALRPMEVLSDEPPRYSVAVPMELRSFWEPPPSLVPWQDYPVVTPSGTDDPPRYSVVSTMEVRGTWEPPPPMPRQLPLTIAPLTFTYGQNPPLGNWPSDIALNPIIRSWQPPDPVPWQKPLTEAPLILTYGQQPPPRTDYAQAVLPSWIPPFRMPQTLIGVSAWIVPVIFVQQAYAPLPASILASWQPQWIAPPRPVQIVPLTFTYGQEPPRYSTAIQNEIVALWRPVDPQPQAPIKSVLPGWSVDNPPNFVSHTQEIQAWWTQPPFLIPQAAPKSAAFQVVIVSQPYTSLPMQILEAWQAPWVKPPSPVVIAPLTLRYGSQPPIIGGSQSLPLIIRSWQPPDPMPRQLPLTIAPLTITYGQQPPVIGWSQSLPIIIRAWEPPPPQPMQLPLIIAPVAVGPAVPIPGADSWRQIERMLTWEQERDLTFVVRERNNVWVIHGKARS